MSDCGPRGNIGQIQLGGGGWGLWLLNISDVMQCQTTPPPPPSICGLNQVGMRYISRCSTCSEQAAVIRSLDRMGSPDLKQKFFQPKESRADAVGRGGGSSKNASHHQQRPFVKTWRREAAYKLANGNKVQITTPPFLKMKP